LRPLPRKHEDNGALRRSRSGGNAARLDQRINHTSAVVAARDNHAPMGEGTPPDLQRERDVGEIELGM
jgi:hypothetical protein